MSIRAFIGKDIVAQKEVIFRQLGRPMVLESPGSGEGINLLSIKPNLMVVTLHLYLSRNRSKI